MVQQYQGKPSSQCMIILIDLVAKLYIHRQHGNEIRRTHTGLKFLQDSHTQHPPMCAMQTCDIENAQHRPIRYIGGCILLLNELLVLQ